MMKTEMGNKGGEHA